MKTDDLIAVLAADSAPPRRVWPDIAAGLMLPVLVLGAVFLWAINVRADLLTALVTQPTLWKWLLPITLAGSGLALSYRLSRPEAGVGWVLVVPFGVLATAAVLALSQMSVLPSSAWRPTLMGDTHLICLPSIFGMGLPGLLIGLAILKRGATARPAVSGLAAGLAAGGLAAALYATHCDEDAPLFFVTWYGLAIIALGALGAVLGPKILRW